MSQTVVNQGASGPGVIYKKRLELNFSTIASALTREVTGALADADAGDGVFFSPTAALTAGVVNGGARCSATGVVACVLGNLTASTVTLNTVTVDVYVIKGGLDV